MWGTYLWSGKVLRHCWWSGMPSTLLCWWSCSSVVHYSSLFFNIFHTVETIGLCRGKVVDSYLCWQSTLSPLVEAGEVANKSEAYANMRLITAPLHSEHATQLHGVRGGTAIGINPDTPWGYLLIRQYSKGIIGSVVKFDRINASTLSVQPLPRETNWRQDFRSDLSSN